MSGGGGFKAKVVGTLVHKPVQVYLGVGAALYGIRTYQTANQYNYWFGKNEFERRVANGKL